MTTGPAFDTRRARLAAYVPWMLRDYLTNQGPATLIVVLLIGYMALMPVLDGPTGVSLGDVPPEMAHRIMLAILPAFAFLAPFFATNGLFWMTCTEPETRGRQFSSRVCTRPRRRGGSISR